MKWLVYNDCERKVFKICFNKKIFLILSTSIIILSPPSSTMSNKNTYLKRSSWRQNAQCQSGTLILLYFLFCCTIVNHFNCLPARPISGSVAGFYESEIREGFKIKKFKKSTKMSFKKYPPG